MFTFNTNLVELNLSNFDTTKVTNMFHMFNADTSLAKLYFNSATFDNVNIYDDLFYNVPSNITILTKNETTKSWLETRLNGVGTVTIAS